MNEAAFWSKVERTGDGCWIWQGALGKDGYGVLKFNGHHTGAHRAAYIMARGPIPDGMQIDHLCRNRLCVRPSHLEVVTCRENLMRGRTIQAANAAKTHCKQGHPFDADNTKITTRGQRRCRTCHRIQSRRRAARVANA